VRDLQGDYGLVPGFEGEEGFYWVDEEKAKGKELWLRLDTIVIVMHSGMGTDLLAKVGRICERQEKSEPAGSGGPPFSLASRSVKPIRPGYPLPDRPYFFHQPTPLDLQGDSRSAEEAARSPVPLPCEEEG